MVKVITGSPAHSRNNSHARQSSERMGINQSQEEHRVSVRQKHLAEFTFAAIWEHQEGIEHNMPNKQTLQTNNPLACSTSTSNWDSRARKWEGLGLVITVGADQIPGRNQGGVHKLPSLKIL